MEQLYAAEHRFVDVWTAAVLPLPKNGAPLYQIAFGLALQQIGLFLDGTAPGNNTDIKKAIADSNLEAAVSSQEQIVTQIGDQSSKPFGAFVVTYLGANTSMVKAGIPFDMRFEVNGTLTPDDALRVTPFVDSQTNWSLTPKNDNGSTPLDLKGGPGAFTRQFRVGVTPPVSANAEALISIEVTSQANPAGVGFQTTQKHFALDAAPPLGEDQFAITVFNWHVPVSLGVYQVPKGQLTVLTFKLVNSTNTAVSVDMVRGSSGNWNVQDGGTYTNQNVGSQPLYVDYGFTAPNQEGDTLSWELKAVQTGNNTQVYASIIVKLTSV